MINTYHCLAGFSTNHLSTAILNWHFNHSFYSVIVDGGWSRWSVWTTCTKSCESGTQTRSRSCTQPPPQHGGRTCPGAARDQRVCNTQSCPGMQFNRHLFLLLPIIAPLREKETNPTRPGSPTPCKQALSSIFENKFYLHDNRISFSYQWFHT